MGSLWTNPSYERSVVQINNVSAEISYYARIKLTPMTDICSKPKEVLVFPGMEYNIKFYDINLGSVRSVTCLVSKIVSGCNTCTESYIEAVCKSDKDDCTPQDKKCVSSIKPGSIPLCNCVLNPPNADKYNAPDKLYIPFNNIINISFNRDNLINNCGNGVKVMVLGISASVVKAIIVRLDFFDDNAEDAVKCVELVKNNIYDITYLCKSNGNMYEVRGKLEGIVEVTDDEECKSGKGFVRENVALNGNVIHSHAPSKDEFMKSPPAKKIKLIIDTSDDFSGRYECVMLDSIRDCVFIAEGEKEPVAEDICSTCTFKRPDCDPTECGYYPTTCGANVTKYSIDGYDVTVDGDQVSIESGEESFKISMRNLVEFYLGIG